MSSKRKIVSLCYTIWFIVSVLANADTDSRLALEGCQYVDAFSVDCWWKKNIGNSSTNLRLSYIKNSDHLDKQVIRYCSPTLQSTNFNGDVIEHCEIEDGVLPFATFTLFLSSSACDKNSTDCKNTTGPEIKFSCDPYNVVLQVGPSNFVLDLPHRQLTWEPPEKEDSSMQFVSSIIETKYKLVYRVTTNEKLDNQNNWKNWYIGKRESFYLGHLIPGAVYETKVFASVQNSPNDEDIVWSPASQVIQFTAPFPVHPNTSTVTVKNNTPTLHAHQATTIHPNAVNGTVLSARQTAGAIWLVCVLVITFAMIFSLITYVLVYKKLCCCCPNNVKIPKPVVMVEMDNFSQHPCYYDANEAPDTIPVTSLLQHSTKRNGMIKQISCTLKDVYPSIVLSRPNSCNEKQNGRFRTRGDHPSLDSDDVSYSDASDPMWLDHGNNHGRNIALPSAKRRAVKQNSIESQPMLENSNMESKEGSCSTSNGLFYPHDKTFLCDNIGGDKHLEIHNPKSENLEDLSIERYDNMDYVGEVCPKTPCLLHEKAEQFKKTFLKDKGEEIPDYIQITSNLRGRQNEHVSVYVASNIDTSAFDNGVILKKVANSCECKLKAKQSDDKICDVCRLKPNDPNSDLVFIAGLYDLQSVQLGATSSNNNTTNRSSSSSSNSVDSGYSPDASGRM